MVKLLPADAEGVARAASILRSGGLVAIPTETVYGLAGNALDARAVHNIFVAKARPPGHPLIVHVADLEHAKELCAEFPPEAEALARAFWPGPLTLVLPRAAHVPEAVTGGRDTVAVRVPAHPIALAVLRATQLPLAAPSANHHEHISPTTAAHVRDSLAATDLVELVLDAGPTSAGIESSLLDLSRDPPQLLRLGPLAPQRLSAVLPSLQVQLDRVELGASHSAPGQSRRHYAPRVPLSLLSLDELRMRAAEPGVAWLCCGAPVPSLPGHGEVLPAQPEAYASGLYAALHRLENVAIAHILVQRPPEGQAWWAVHDRLRRASSV